MGKSNLTRRQFLNAAAGSAASLSLAGHASDSYALSAGALRGRFLTHISLVRVNQIEVTAERSIGLDEAADNTPEHIRARREAFERGRPGGKITWAISWLALHDSRQQYQEARRLLASYHHEYGDEITFVPGGYHAPMYDTPENIRKTIHSAANDLSDGWRWLPPGVPGGRFSWHGEPEVPYQGRRHPVCQGQIWSQHAIDYGDGDGGICYPYYPSREHYLKPAQGPADFIDCVCLDGWTCDFLPARRDGFQGGFNSRLGVGPIETVGNLGTEVGRREMMDTTTMHFERGRVLNGFGWVTSIWEVSIGHHDDLTWWLQAVTNRWSDSRVMTEGAFGLEWRKHTPNNASLNYRFDARGTGAPGSEKELEIQWFMNREFRLALLHDWTKSSPPLAIDFTLYDLPAHELQTLQREWSLMNVLNQKGTRPQDKPIRLGQMAADDQRRIFARYPELKKFV